MPRIFSHCIIVAAWLFAVLAAIFSITGGLDQIFFRPNDVQILSVPLFFSAFALWVLASKPSWVSISQDQIRVFLSVALASMIFLVTVQVLFEIADRMLLQYWRYIEVAGGKGSTDLPPRPLAIPGAPSSIGYSLLDSYRSVASRSVLPDWWSWGRFLVWTLAAIVLSSAILKLLQRLSSPGTPPVKTKDEELKELEQRIWARGFFLKARAVLALILIFAVLAAGGSFIYNAGRLIEVETREETRLDRLRSVRNDLQSEVDQASQRLDDLRRQKLAIDLSLSSAKSLSLPEIPEIKLITESGSDTSDRDLEAMLAHWAAFASDVCRTTLGKGTRPSSSLSFCSNSELSSILSQIQVLSTTRDELNDTLKQHSRDLALELTGADGRPAGDGPRARGAREGIDQFQALLAELNLESLSLEQDLIAARQSAESDISTALREAHDQKNLAVFHVLLSTWLRSISAFETEAGYLSDTITQISNDVGAKLTAINKIDETISTDIERVFPEEIKSGPDWPTLMATALTRVSILLILVFLVQILVGLYRYSLRLAAFYDARADALSLGHVDDESFTKWTEVLSPQDIDFGRSPTSPSQHLENMVTKIIDRRKKDDDAAGGGKSK